MKIVNWLAASAMLILTGRPALAAEDFRYINAQPERRTAAFAGALIRMPLGHLGSEARALPTARLHLGAEHVYRDRRSATAAIRYRTAGLELGLLDNAAPKLFVAGAPIRKAKGRLGISTGGAIAIGAGVMLLAILAAAAASAPPDEITP
jgi:hypothetical protein